MGIFRCFHFYGVKRVADEKSFCWQKTRLRMMHGRLNSLNENFKILDI